MSASSPSPAGRAKSSRYIVVSKQRLTLTVIEGRDTLLHVPVACGKDYGNKKTKDDCCTPEGTFRIYCIENATRWPHDPHDGTGTHYGDYGEWFFRLNVPEFRSIGIHGTCYPESIGTRSSEGCVRMYNEDNYKLKALAFAGMKVIIEPDKK